MVRELRQTASLVKSGLMRKVGVVLLVPFGASLVALFVFWNFLGQTASAPAHLNLTGRQRMLAVQLGDWAGMVASGHAEDQPRLRELIDTFERTLVVLERGGELNGSELPAVPEGPQAEVARLRTLWNELRPRLQLIAERPAGSPESVRAASGLGSAIEDLRLSADALTRALESRTERLHQRIHRLLVAGFGLNVALLLFGLWYARRYIIRPMLMMDHAAQGIIDGDYSVRLVCKTRDELCHLAATFNEMAERVQGLLVAIDHRRRHAETLAESLPLGTALLDGELAVVRTNRSFRELLGQTEAELHGRPICAILQVAGLRARLLPVIENGASVERFDAALHLANGVRHLQVSATGTHLVEGEEEDEARLLLVIEDLTEEARLRAEAGASEESFRSLIEWSPEAIAVHRDGRFVYVNPALVSSLGYEANEDLIGTSVSAIVHPDDRAVVARRIQTMLATGEPTSPAEERYVRRDGGVITAEVVALKVMFRGESAVVAIARDVSERKNLMARMMEMDRMITVGTLAAGVGHEINNPLSYVIANLDLLAEELPRVVKACRLHQLQVAPVVGDAPGPGAVSMRLDELIELLDDARQGAARVRSIVRDLKTLSRAEKEQRVLLDVRRLLESSVNMAWNEIRHRARLKKDYGVIPPVEANEARLGQVFINLLVNAAQAIPEGAADTNSILLRTRCDGEWVFIEVEDSGVGISEEDLRRLFEPFFTTKPVGRGTGLGLSICKQTVASHGGQIEVESEVGRGTLFRVKLPAARVPEAEPVSATEPMVAATPRRARLLVVDDEPLVGRALQRALVSDHDVVVLTSARDAKARLASGERFDLIFCDLMMPEMTGMALHAELLEATPEQAEKMIFLTGGAFTPHARKFLDSVPNQRIDKPFDMRNLRALVRDLVK